ncbi:MAG: hypothetical protein HDT20_06840 [Oscillibacter sp.]|nr:hypothetical protein [Oscillibacter sp.]
MFIVALPVPFVTFHSTKSYSAVLGVGVTVIVSVPLTLTVPLVGVIAAVTLAVAALTRTLKVFLSRFPQETSKVVVPVFVASALTVITTCPWAFVLPLFPTTAVAESPVVALTETVASATGALFAPVTVAVTVALAVPPAVNGLPVTEERESVVGVTGAGVVEIVTAVDGPPFRVPSVPSLFVPETDALNE